MVLKQTQSTSGKYTLFYGYHYVKGHTCYDVGSINRLTGEIISRHYLDEGNGNPKAEALHIFHEYEQALTKRGQIEEQDDNDPRVADAFRRALTQRNPGKA